MLKSKWATQPDEADKPTAPAADNTPPKPKPQSKPAAPAPVQGEYAPVCRPRCRLYNLCFHDTRLMLLPQHCANKLPGRQRILRSCL